MARKNSWRAKKKKNVIWRQKFKNLIFPWKIQKRVKNPKNEVSRQKKKNVKFPAKKKNVISRQKNQKSYFLLEVPKNDYYVRYIRLNYYLTYIYRKNG